MKFSAFYIPSFQNCISDFYIKDNNFFIKDFNSTSYYSISFPDQFYSNFVFDDSLNICYSQKNELLTNLMIYESQFNFLMGLTSILIAFCFLIGLVIIGATR